MIRNWKKKKKNTRKPLWSIINWATRCQTIEPPCKKTPPIKHQKFPSLITKVGTSREQLPPLFWMTVLEFSMLFFLHSFIRRLGSWFALYVCCMSFTTQDMRRTFSDTTWHYTLHAMNSLPKCRCVKNASLVWIDPLGINNSRKWPSPVSDHYIFALQVVPYTVLIHKQSNWPSTKNPHFQNETESKDFYLNENRRLFMYFHNNRLFTVPLFFCKIVRIEHLPLKGSHLGSTMFQV